VWSGQAVSFVSSGAAGFAIIWYLSIATASATILALGTIAYFIPLIVLGPLAGAIVDRYNRKYIIIISDLCIAFITILVALMISAGLTSVPLILAMLLLRSVGATFHQPAMQATMPLLVPERHLVRIGSLDQGIIGLSNIVAPALGILLYTSMGLHSALFVDAAGALIACGILAFATIPNVHLAKSERTSLRREMADGMRAIKNCRGMGTFFALITVCCIAYMPMSAFFPLMTSLHFLRDGYSAAIVEAVWSVGFLLGSIVLGIWGGGRRLVPLIVISVGVCGALVVACGLLPPAAYWAFVVLTGLMAITGAFFNSPLIAVIQKNIEPAQLGRVMAVFGALTSLASPIGLVISGPVADVIGVAPLFVASGALMLLIALAALFFPVINNLDHPKEAPTPKTAA
jgi:DHA3 family macrolide efflux protein-like MFS transporter